MAMLCCRGSRECDGCCDCQAEKQDKVAGRCACCGEPVMKYEDRYELPDDDIVHDDCILDYIREHFFKYGEGDAQ